MSQTLLTISGRVTQDPKIKVGKTSGDPFCIVPVAVNTDRFDRNQEKWVNVDTTYYELVCFGVIGANAAASLKIGDPVLAIGRFKVSSYETDSYRSQTPTITCEHLGPDLRFGTSSFTKGQAGYGTDRVDEDVDFQEVHAERALERAAAGGEVDDGPRADEHGEVSEEEAEAYLARSA